MTAPATPGPSADLIATINRYYAAANTTDVLTAALACGAGLNEARDLVPRRGWLKWLGANCPAIHQTTANDYMRLAANRQLIEAAKAKGTPLSLRAALSLIPPKAPRTTTTSDKTATTIGTKQSTATPAPRSLATLAPADLFAELRQSWDRDRLNKLAEMILDMAPTAPAPPPIPAPAARAASTAAEVLAATSRM